MKKKIALTLAMLLSLACFAACGGEDDEEPTNNSGYTQVLSTQETRSLNVDQKAKFPIDKNIAGKEYVKIELKTDVQLLGTFEYADVNDPSKVVEEEFFIEASDGKKTVEFTQFFDAFRANAIGNFDKILKSVSFTNKSGVPGEVTLVDVSVSAREFPVDALLITLERGELKLGADLATGGTLSYLERTSYAGTSVDEYINKNDEVTIAVGGGSSSDCKQYLSSEVNVVNIYDAGRQIQQSYYAAIGGTEEETNGENGYNRAWCYTGADGGYYWPYNPVQAGDCGDNPSQVVDFEVTKDTIYVKTRAMDWGKGIPSDRTAEECPGADEDGETTKSYMENWYTIENNLVHVKNRFIDWNGFTDMNAIRSHTNELPALFVSHAFRNFVCYDGAYPWKNDKLTVKNASNIYPHNVTGQSVYSDEEWYAWVNDDMFGIGVYIPNTTYFAYSRPLNHSRIDNYKNYGATNCPLIKKDLINNKPEPTSTFTSCYVYNLNYTATVVSWQMHEYEAMEYEYVIAYDYVDIMRGYFKNIYDNGTMTNDKLDDWL